MRVPTKQIQRYSDEQAFKPSSTRILFIIFRICKSYDEPFVISFHEINKEIGKSRIKGKFVRGTLNYVKEQILNCSVVKVKRQLSPYVFEIVLLPFGGLKKVEESAEKMTHPISVAKPEKQEPELDTELLSEDSGIEQQQLISTIKVCQEAGINYNRRDWIKIARYGIDVVIRAVLMFKHRALTSLIGNPEGWLLRCLQFGWYKTFRLPDVPVTLLQQLENLKSYLMNTYGIVPT